MQWISLVDQISLHLCVMRASAAAPVSQHLLTTAATLLWLICLICLTAGAA